MVFLAQHVQEFVGEIYLYLFSLNKAIGNFVQALFHVSLYILYAGTYHWYLCDYSITYWLLIINEVRFKLNKGNKNINILGK